MPQILMIFSTILSHLQPLRNDFLQLPKKFRMSKYLLLMTSSAHDGNARPPASGIPREGLQCTEHLKYMGTICGGNVVLNDLEEFGRFKADEKSTVKPGNYDHRRDWE